MFENANFVVTGASGGIGISLVNDLLTLNANVCAIDSDVYSLNSLLKSNNFNKNLSIKHSNLSTEEKCIDAVSDLREIHGLIHLAGIFEKDDMEVGDTEGIYKDTMNANIKNGYSMCIACLPAMKRAKKSRAIFISSVAFNMGSQDYVAYSASKGAIVGMVRALSKRLAPNILVNAIAPGLIETSMINQVVKDRGIENILDTIPLKRLGSSDEIAKVIKFLLSEDSSYITGQVINVDGGKTLF